MSGRVLKLSCIATITHPLRRTLVLFDSLLNNIQARSLSFQVNVFSKLRI